MILEITFRSIVAVALTAVIIGMFRGLLEVLLSSTKPGQTIMKMKNNLQLWLKEFSKKLFKRR
jgi:hypothetical protein